MDLVEQKLRFFALAFLKWKFRDLVLCFILLFVHVRVLLGVAKMILNEFPIRTGKLFYISESSSIFF